MRRLIARHLVIDSRLTMDSSKPQSRPILPHRLNLFSRVSTTNAKHARRNLLILVAKAAAIVAVFFCLSVVVITRGRTFRSHLRKKGYGVVIDGGSTGTRIHVYSFFIERGVPVLDFGMGGSATTKVNPGLSSFSGDPESAGRSLLQLLEFGKGIIPRESWEETEIRLMATAGMRRLTAEVQERILQSCRRALSSSGFLFQDDWASVITGSDEGIYAWVAANYALGTLGGDPQETTGIIELGGASAQVTFVSSEPLPPEFSRTVKFGKFTYNLYSNSLLHFGQNVAYDSLHELLISNDLKLSIESIQDGMFIDPCTPRGYSPVVKSFSLSTGVLNVNNEHPPTIHARGNFSECRSAALMLLQKGKDACLYKHCHIGSTFIPELKGKKFLATENFFYTSEFFGLSPRAFLSDLMLAGQQFCEEEWLNLKKKYHTRNEDDLLGYCFSSAYIVALLHDSLGIPLNDERIGFANQVGDMPLDWALGAFILQKTSSDQSGEHLGWMASIISDDSPALLSLFFVSSVLIFTAWSMAKWRKPQLKTIYDLEKGRYIVTRVNR